MNKIVTVSVQMVLHLPFNDKGIEQAKKLHVSEYENELQAGIIELINGDVGAAVVSAIACKVEHPLDIFKA